MLQLENRTPFVPGAFVFPDEQGVDTLYLAIKATFEVVAGRVRLAERQKKLVLADEYWGEPGKTSLKHATEAHLSKPATDVVVIGSAHAPGGRPAAEFLARVSVGRLEKTVRVVGDRHWTKSLLGVRPSEPEGVVRVPIRYELAFGGGYEDAEGNRQAEARNPVGRGFLGKQSPGLLEGLPLPNLEDPLHPLAKAGSVPAPCSFGYVAPNWHPRSTFAGTYDETWFQSRAPYLPLDFDARFFQAVPSDQVYPGQLCGGEPVELLNLSPQGLQRFSIPEVALDVVVSMCGTHRPVPKLETLELMPDEEQFSLLWRAALPCDKKALKIERMTVSLMRLEGVAG